MRKCLAFFLLQVFCLSALPFHPDIQLDETHDPNLRSWVESANIADSDFPIQNLPYGVFRRSETDEESRIGVAIGDQILDMRGVVESRLLKRVDPEIQEALKQQTLNPLMSLGRAKWKEARRAISRLLRPDHPKLKKKPHLKEHILVAMDDAEMLMPVAIGDYTDFYCSIHHAKNVGSLFRPENPLLPNYRHMPIGYHGRASSVILSGVGIKRPMGPLKKTPDENPVFGKSERLDYELEMGVFVGSENPLGKRVPIEEAPEHLFGMVIVNDWSARDIQKWEYRPLGPFNGKNFATSISPWVVTMEALEPYRVSEPEREIEDPPLLPYLKPVTPMGIDIVAEAYLCSEKMRQQGQKPQLLSKSQFKDMYWTLPQMFVQHTVSGCNMQPGDLIASGTISGPTDDSRASLLEISAHGPVELSDGTTRTFLQDGDEVIMRAWSQEGDGPRIGFGQCRAIVLN